MQLPSACPSGKAKPCRSTSFRHVSELQQHIDFQELRVQEKSQSLDMHAAPQSKLVVLQDDLVDTCQPGGERVLRRADRRGSEAARAFVTLQRTSLKSLRNITFIDRAGVYECHAGRVLQSGFKVSSACR